MEGHVWCFGWQNNLCGISGKVWSDVVQLSFAICSWVKKREKMSRKTHMAAFVLYYFLMMSLENCWADEVVEASCFLFMQSASWRPSSWKFGEEQSGNISSSALCCGGRGAFVALVCLVRMPLLSKHTNTLTTTTFRQWKQNSTTLRVSDHTINAFPYCILLIKRLNCEFA